MGNYTIDKMTLDDINSVLEVERLSFFTPWSEKAFTLELTNNKNALYKVIKDGDKVIAYGGVWLLFDEGHITNIAVHPAYRGSGLGNTLLKDIMESSRKENISSMTLEVRESNIPAINLYKKNGFKSVGKRKGYYQDTKEDAIIMWNYNL